MKSKNLRNFIDALRIIEDPANKPLALNMLSPYVNSPASNIKPGGVPHCLAGWYAIAKGYPQVKPNDYYGFSHSSRAVAVALGFDYSGDFASWANKHWLIWGNRKGSSVLSDLEAYGAEDGIAKNPMTVILLHLEGVYKRLYWLEMPKRIFSKLKTRISRLGRG